MTTDNVRTAIVTGANRGIGLAVVRGLAQRGYVTVLGARDLARGEEAAAQLARDGLEVLPRRLDVTDQSSIEALAAEMTTSFGRLDVLVNNAGILFDTWQSPLDIDTRPPAQPTRRSPYVDLVER